MTPFAPPWRRLPEALLLGVVFATILVEWAEYTARVSRLSYALLVPVLAAILAAVPRGPGGDAGPPTLRDRFLGSLLLLVAAACLGMGSLAGIFTLSVLGFPMAVVGLAVSWRGIGALRRRSWAAALLFLMIPVPMPLLDRLNPQLTQATGRVAVILVRPFDTEAAWAGSDLSFRGWTLVVEEACSGSGTFLTYLVLTTFLAGLFRPSWIAAAILFALVVPMTLLVNGLRIGTTALLLDHLGPQAAQGWAHELLGQGLVIGAAGLLAGAVAWSAHRRGGTT